MKIESVAGPTVASPPQTTNSAQAARERAIAMLTKGPDTSQELPVKNATNVSPEEISAIKPPSTKEVDIKKDTSDGSESEAPKQATADDPLSSKYAHLARKERAIRLQQQELKKQQDAFKAQQAELAAKAPKEPDLSNYVPKDRLSTETLQVLQEMGITYDKLTQDALNAPSPERMEMLTEIKALRDELKAIKGEQENTKKAMVEQQNEAYNQAIAQIKSDVTDLVRANPSFELIKSTNSVKDVVELIERTYKEDKRLLTVEQAAEKVEEYLTEEAIKLARLGKIQQRLKPAAPTAPKQEPPKTEGQKQQPGMNTLTNSVGSQKPMTSRQRAILAFEGKLK